MKLQKLQDKIYYYPYEAETDRPALIYIRGEKYSLAVDAGNSKSHVEEFYSELAESNLKLPDFTILTHWHWDHTFGMKYVNGVTLALDETNRHLRKTKTNFENPEFLERVHRENEYFRTEYGDESIFEIVESDICFPNEIRINLGGINVHAYKIVNPHTDDHLLIHIPEAKVILLGDSTGEDSYNFGFGSFFMDGLMDRELLQSLIDRIDGIDCELCILSHVDYFSKEDLLKDMREMLKR